MVTFVFKYRSLGTPPTVCYHFSSPRHGLMICIDILKANGIAPTTEGKKRAAVAESEVDIKEQILDIDDDEIESLEGSQSVHFLSFVHTIWPGRLLRISILRPSIFLCTSHFAHIEHVDSIIRTLSWSCTVLSPTVI